MALTTLERWYRVGADLVRPGHNVTPPDQTDPAPPVVARDALVAGTYEPTGVDTNPTDATAGVPYGTVLTDYNSSSATAVSIPNGTVLTAKKVYGTVTLLGSATFYKCLFVGGPNPATYDGDSVVNAYNNRTGIAKFYDCTLKPQQESNGRDCIRGRQFELYRCELVGGVDGAGVFSPAASIPCNVIISACVIRDLVFVYPDAIGSFGGHSNPGGGTHNDCVQYQGGKSVRIVGNRLHGSSHHLPGTGTGNTQDWIISAGYAQGGGVIMQDNTGAGCDSTVIVEKNYFWGCTSHVNLKASAAGWQYLNNKHHYNAVGTPAIAGHWSYGYFVRAQTRTALNAVVGLHPNTTNVWCDGPRNGLVLAEPTPSFGIMVDSEA